MTDFSFNASSLFDSGATPVSSRTVMPDAPGAGEQLARSKKCALWLRAELIARGFAPQALDADEGGWMITVSAPAEQGHAMLILNGGGSAGEAFDLVSLEIGSAPQMIEHMDAAVTELLKGAPFVTHLSITD
ncbi:hypothetical protein [Novosphingobium terrae]|uniref:hypothetical protein n=1 Tax=Novosphingobium terrae TaxID=2726189 RepID=UPI00197CEB2C|nr:hypothetical protein [Novosphingobium terrae]